MKRFHIAACVVILILSCAASVTLGKDGNWDLLNYHFYNPYMLLNGRLYTDFLPAQTQTHLNPLMDIPTYLMISGLRPVMVGGVMGMFHGLNLVLIYLLTLAVFNGLGARREAVLAAGVTVLSAGGSIVRGLFGTFMGDLTMSVFVLAAVYALVSAIDTTDDAKRMRRIAWSGLMIGVATGLKSTALFHAIPLVLLSVVFGKTVHGRLKAFVFSAAGFAAGFALTYGYWAIVLYQRFESPFFPYYNAWFRSPYAVPRNLTDFLHWKPDMLLDHLTLPFTFLLPEGGLGQAEIYFREWRPGIAFIALGGLAAVMIWRAVRRYPPMFNLHAQRTLLLSGFFVLSWVIWQTEFSYYRYTAALELLAPLLIVAIAYVMVPRIEALGVVLVALAILLLPTTVPMDYGRKPWTDDYFEVRIPESLRLENAQVFIADLDRPLGYLIPFLPSSVQVLRLTSNMDSLLYSDGVQGRLIDEIYREIARPARKVVLFVNQRYTADASRADVRPRVALVLERYGLAMIDAPCKKIRSAFHTVTVCELAVMQE